MARIVLVHWNAAEARERAAMLRRLGHRVTTFAEPSGGAGLRAYCKVPPDLFVIDLARLPSHGGAVGTFLRQAASTRRVPLVFVEGLPEKTAKVRALLPDATYCRWSRIDRAVTGAVARPVKQPIVPGTMAGYSGTPLPKKLGIREGSHVALVGAPRGYAAALQPLPTDAAVGNGLRGTPDVILLFVRSAADLERRWPAASTALARGGRLWIVWPKKTSALAGDVGEKEVRAHGMARSFVDYKICALDQTWSGLCFARRAARG